MAILTRHFTFTYFGFAAVDTPAVIDTPPTCAVADAHTDFGTYPIVCSGGVDDAYTFTYVPGTLTVTPHALDVTPNSFTKLYGSVFNAFTGNITGIQFGDAITANYASAGCRNCDCGPVAVSYHCHAERPGTVSCQLHRKPQHGLPHCKSTRPGRAAG